MLKNILLMCVALTLTACIADDKPRESEVEIIWSDQYSFYNNIYIADFCKKHEGRTFYVNFLFNHDLLITIRKCHDWWFEYFRNTEQTLGWKPYGDIKTLWLLKDKGGR